MRPATAAPRHLRNAVFLVALLGLLLQAACLPQLDPPPLSSRQQQQVRILLITVYVRRLSHFLPQFFWCPRPVTRCVMLCRATWCRVAQRRGRRRRCGWGRARRAAAASATRAARARRCRCPPCRPPRRRGRRARAWCRSWRRSPTTSRSGGSASAATACTSPDQAGAGAARDGRVFFGWFDCLAVAADGRARRWWPIRPVGWCRDSQKARTVIIIRLPVVFPTRHYFRIRRGPGVEWWISVPLALFFALVPGI